MARLTRLPRAKYDPALPTLRRRTSRLISSLGPRGRAFLRLIPVLLDARFRRPSLDVEPPGLEQAPRRRRWGKLCEQIDLPPPMSYSQHRPLVKSVILAPTGGGPFELLVIPVDGLKALELNRVVGRVDALQQLAVRLAPNLIRARMAGPAELTPSLFAWAAVVAGDLPSVPASAAFDWHDAFARAPTPLLRCLMLLVPPDGGSPLELIRTSQMPASPEAFVANWSGSPVARDITSLEGKTLSPAALDGLAHQLRGACLRALRSFPPRERKGLLELVRPALLGRHIPPVLRSYLDRAIEAGEPREVEVEDAWELQMDGLVLARGRSLDQLRATAVTESPRLARNGPFWQRLSAAIEARAARALVLIEPTFLKHLVVIVSAAGRPRARRTDTTGVLQFILTWRRAGVPVELIPSPGCDIALIARTKELLATALRPDETIGLQIGNKVLLLEPQRARLLPMATALSRPRILTWLPEQAEMSRALRRPLATGLPTVQLVAVPEGKDHAALFALDARGALYRELVPLDDLEATLLELREVLRRADPPSLLSASVHPLLTSLAGRRSGQPQAVQLIVSLTPDGDQASLDGEAFGSGADLPWSALAEAVLSRWAPGTWEHVAVQRVDGPSGTPGLALLASRARVLRRLNTHLRRISRQLQAA